MSRSIGVSDQVRDYLRRFGAPEHPVLRRCREETERDLAGQARMQISPEQAGFMQMMARLLDARSAIEVGVFTGYSSTAVALALQAAAESGEGAAPRLVACDISEDFVDRARGYWAEAGVAAIIEARIGPATESLGGLLADEGEGGFDLAFIDADKTGYDDYYELCLKLLRPGGLMLIDNMLWGGAVADPNAADSDTAALRALAAKIAADARVDSVLTAIGDGLSICRRR